MARIKPKISIRPRLFINVGAGLDIPIGSVVTGAKGESIINGGLAPLTGVVGGANTFKSTISHYLMLSACNHIRSTHEAFMHTYDTEGNLFIDSLKRLIRDYDWIDPQCALPVGIDGSTIDSDSSCSDYIWALTDNTTDGDQWFNELKDYLVERHQEKSEYAPYTAFLYQGKTYKHLIPFFVEIDSLSRFMPSVTAETLSSGGIGESNKRTIFMQKGLSVTQLIMQLTGLSNRENVYFILVAQMGQNIHIPTNPMQKPPPKKLHYLRANDKIRGVSDEFIYSMNSVWYIYETKRMIDKDRGLEYPSKQRNYGNEDLHLARLLQLRGKNGPTGVYVDLIVSQYEGVLPGLSEFHRLRSNWYGLSGNRVTYHLDLYPKVKLTRKSVRDQIDQDPRLRRAIQISSELYQIRQFWPQLEEYYMDPKDLYNKLVEQGYNWDELLDTRGWWAINQYEHTIPLLSTIDLLRMAKGLYHPYWMGAKD
jgi:hypothetical protein